MRKSFFNNYLLLKFNCVLQIIDALYKCKNCKVRIFFNHNKMFQILYRPLSVKLFNHQCNHICSVATRIKTSVASGKNGICLSQPDASCLFVLVSVIPTPVVTAFDVSLVMGCWWKQLNPFLLQSCCSREMLWETCSSQRFSFEQIWGSCSTGYEIGLTICRTSWEQD